MDDQASLIAADNVVQRPPAGDEARCIHAPSSTVGGAQYQLVIGIIGGNGVHALDIVVRIAVELELQMTVTSRPSPLGGGCHSSGLALGSREEQGNLRRVRAAEQHMDG